MSKHTSLTCPSSVAATCEDVCVYHFKSFFIQTNTITSIHTYTGSLAGLTPSMRTAVPGR